MDFVLLADKNQHVDKYPYGNAHVIQENSLTGKTTMLNGERTELRDEFADQMRILASILRFS